MIKAVIFDMYETLITHYESPLYFSEEMARDAGITADQLRPTWYATEVERTTGKITFEQIIETILRENDCYTEEKMGTIIRKRVETKKDLFKHLHPNLLPMLDALKERGLKIGLISNCFSEEAIVIRDSILFPYFDAPCMSFEEGVQKPDVTIYHRCLSKLKLTPEECMYVGDGGSHELEVATKLGMKAVQATWYLKEGTLHNMRPMPEFDQAKDPMEILNFL